MNKERKEHYKNSSAPAASSAIDSAMIDWDPASLLVQTLMSTYADTFLLFYDEHGGDVICGVWNPALDTPRTFKQGLGFNSRIESSEDGKLQGIKVKANREAILNEIALLAGHMVENVEFRR